MSERRYSPFLRQHERPLDLELGDERVYRPIDEKSPESAALSRLSPRLVRRDSSTRLARSDSSTRLARRSASSLAA